VAALTPRDAYLRRTYGITEAEYHEMLDRQGGVCAICLRPPKAGKNLHVDHDHVSGWVRGLLCMTCNHDLLGRRDQDPDLFRRAAAYLEDPPAPDALDRWQQVPARPKRKRNSKRKPGVVRTRAPKA
jgi:hypothetical protein